MKLVSVDCCKFLCLSEESGDQESEEEDERERDPVPEVTEIRFVPDDANSCELPSVLFACGASSLLVGCQEEHLACKR